MRYPFYILHIPIVQSPDSEANNSLFGENTTLETQFEWLVKVLMSYPLDTLYIFIVLSEDPDAI